MARCLLFASRKELAMTSYTSSARIGAVGRAAATPIPIKETARCEALAELGILDTPAEQCFDGLVRLAAQICGASGAALGLVDGTREWFKARHGIAALEVPRAVSFGAHALVAQTPLFRIEDARADERFAASPLVAGEGVRACIAVPLATSRGHKVGVLCVVDRVARTLGEGQEAMLRALGRQAEALLELRRASLGAEARRDEPLQLHQRRREVAAELLHDLRDPISVIQANAQFALHQPLGEGARAALEDVVAGARSLHDLVRNLLDISRADDGGLAPRRADLDLAALVRDAVLRLEPRACDRRQRVELAFGAPSLRLRADGDLLRRLVEILVDHAIKYTPEDGTVRVEAAARDGALEIRVSDGGPGIPPALRERVFQRVPSGDGGSDDPARSSPGLGLLFCRLAAESHGGRIFIEEAARGGACFCVRLPVE